MLSKQRDDFSLWTNYAQLIATQKSKGSDVRQIFVTCLTTDAKRVREDEMRLYANWAEFEWLQNDLARCLNVVVAAVTGAPKDLCELENGTVG